MLEVIVVIVDVILEDVPHLEDVDPMMAARVALIKGPSNVSIARG